jgi:hypothetical protein
MRLLTVAALALLSCNGGATPIPPDTDTDTDSDTDTDTDSDTEPVKCSPDDDNDGWCPPEDCDDSTIWVNPSWAENPDDGIDNNCDGRIDEVFSRMLVLEWDVTTRRTSVIQIDPAGDLKGTFNTGDLAFPTTASLDHDMRRFVAFDPSSLTLWRFDHNGGLAALAVIDEDYEWPNSAGEPDPPPIIGDVVAHPAGYYLVAAGDRLLRFNADGTWSTLAQWPCVEADMTHEFCATALGVDPIYGTVMMFGYFGGVAKWTEAGGYELILASNPEEPGPRFLQTQYKPFDTWYSLALYYDQAASAVTYGIFRLNRTTGEKVLLGSWPDPNFQPNSFSIEETTGDFYFAVNSPRGGRGAYHNQIWRMRADGGTTSILYATKPDFDSNYFVAASVHYTQK